MENLQLIKIDAVVKMCAMSKASIYRKVNKDLFPKPYALSRGGRAVAWRLDEVQKWISELEKAQFTHA
ncbi:helix-turn-helix transcriptional regulator [Serratia fonticola]|uniref:helix-turn-helix transcriptional regulator n=1 Tax=Serratia fonticola TaxID=47917 RepID=UPI0016452750|nr:AlpA family phage regulatory protein [Serratia fonticola]MBC3228661.1 AlpA family phage regulatory protein [Serratia fonticola]